MIYSISLQYEDPKVLKEFSEVNNLQFSLLLVDICFSAVRDVGRAISSHTELKSAKPSPNPLHGTWKPG